jgi:NADPH-dependent ferric siderophore reductase
LIPAIKKRLEHLPKNSIQELILDIRGKNYSEKILEQLRANIQNMVKDIYPDMPVIFMK